MVKISRRSFLGTILSTASVSLLAGSSYSVNKLPGMKVKEQEIIKVFIPLPLQVVIDDTGWWSGEDGSLRQEPYRTGIGRNHVPADYQAIADLGRTLQIRPQAAFVACEWDKKNILRRVPTSTWMGDKWDNSKWVGPWMEEAADILRNNDRHIELSVHGVGHEYWENGKFTRAEWTDSKGQMRPQDKVELHLEYFGRILDQHNLGPLPASFVPAAFRHSFGPSEDRDISLAQILEKRGVRYINTPFSSVYNKERIQYKYFGLDSGVITIDRGNDEFPWLVFPADPSAEVTGPTCGLHWPNMLHPDPERNSEVVARWANYLMPYNYREDRMLAPDSLSFRHQLVHHSLTTTRIESNYIEIDFTETDKLNAGIGKGELTLKVLTDKPQQFKADSILIKKQSLLKAGKFLYTLGLERKSVEPRVRISLD